MDLLDCAEVRRRGALDGPAHQVRRTVAVVYLGKPLLDRHGLAVRAGGHVAARQHAGQDVRCRVELRTQDIGESAFASFDDGAGVVGDQPAQQGIGVPGVAQVPGAIELVQACEGKDGGVTDVVQPAGGFQPVGVRAELRRPQASPNATRPRGIRRTTRRPLALARQPTAAAAEAQIPGKPLLHLRSAAQAEFVTRTAVKPQVTTSRTGVSSNIA
jgi:hypothetical protein